MNKLIKFILITQILILQSFGKDKISKNDLVVLDKKISEANRIAYNIINSQGLKINKKQNIQRTDGSWIIILQVEK